MIPHQTTKSEIDDLRAVIQRDLADAAIVGLSDDRRFATVYNAALQIGKMLLASSGYRTSGLGHHQTTIEGIEIALGNPGKPYAALFDACRRKRNMVDYDMSGIVTGTEVAQLIDETNKFVKVAEAWITKNHPSLARSKP